MNRRLKGTKEVSRGVSSGTVAGLRSRLILPLALGVAVFFVLGVSADYKEVGRALGAFDPGVLPVVLLLALLNYYLRFIRWHYYLALIGVRLDKGESLCVFLTGLAMSVTPGKVGEFLKAYLVKQLSGAPLSRTAPVVLAERVSDVAAIIALSAFGVVVFGYGIKILAAAGVVLVALLGIIACRPIFLGLIGLLGKMPFVSGLAPKAEAAYESASRLLAPVPLLWATLLGVVSWFAECYGLYLVFVGFGEAVPVFTATFVYAFSTLIGALTMLPGGLGATEGSMTGLLALTGVPVAVAAAGTLVIRVCTLWFAVLVGLAAMAWGYRRLNMRYEERVEEGAGS